VHQKCRFGISIKNYRIEKVAQHANQPGDETHLLIAQKNN